MKNSNILTLFEGETCYNKGNEIANERPMFEASAPVLTISKGYLHMATSDFTSNIPYGYCHCGCGQKTPPYKNTDNRFGAKKGEPCKLIHGHSMMPPAERFWSKVAITANPDKCWEWQAGFYARGYGKISIGGRKGKHYPASRYAYILTHGEIPDGLFVCHSCDNPPCCNPSHLFLGTHQDNMADRTKKGREAIGAELPHTKLTPELVVLIRQEFGSGIKSQRQLSKEHGVCQQVISELVRRKTWKWVA